MPTLIAIDWDRREARVVVATTQGRSFGIEQAFGVPWSGEETGDAATAARAAALKSALRERGVSRGDALVTIARGVVELKQLELPPAPDDELPDLVRFQARRELHLSDENAPLDFVAVPAEAGKPRTVLAAAVEAKLIEQIRATCEGAGLRLRRVLLRPCATASLAIRNLADAGRPLRLTVDVGGDEAEIVALAGHDVVLLRAARLSGDAGSSDYARALTSELRRTTAAVQYQAAGRRVESITLCGPNAELTSIAAGLSSELELPVQVVDPAERFSESGARVSAPAELRRRLGPLVGALVDEVESVAPAFDFVNPRRRPEPPNRRRQFVAVGAAVAAVVLVGGGAVWWKLRSLDDQIAALKRQSAQLNPVVKEADAADKRAAEIEKWLQSDVVWLGELARLAERFPPAKEAMLTQLRLTAHALGGEMFLHGAMAESSTGDAIETQLRDATHVVEGRGRRHAPDASRYPWQFQTAIVVKTDEPPPAPTAGGR